MERLYGSHNRARPSRIVCQPSDVILWINTPFDTKNFKRKYESLIKLHHFWRWYFLFFGEAVKNKLTDFGQLFCYPKFFKNKKKKLTDFGQLFWLTGKKLAEIRCRPLFLHYKKKSTETPQKESFKDSLLSKSNPSRVPSRARDRATKKDFKTSRDRARKDGCTVSRNGRRRGKKRSGDMF